MKPQIEVNTNTIYVDLNTMHTHNICDIYLFIHSIAYTIWIFVVRNESRFPLKRLPEALRQMDFFDDLCLKDPKCSNHWWPWQLTAATRAMNIWEKIKAMEE